MNKPLSCPGFALIATLLACLPAAAAPEGEIHSLRNAHVVRRDAGTSLAAAVEEVRASALRDAVWLAWSVALLPGDHDMCCGDFRHGGAGCCACELEDDGGGRGAGPVSEPLALESERRLVVLLRFSAGRTSEVRAYTSDCPLDAGGREVQVLGAVDPSESIRLLAGIAADRDERERSREGALAAIAFHADSRATDVLRDLAADERVEDVREEAVFWLGAAREAAGLEALLSLLGDGADAELREKIAFALHVNESPGGLDALIRLARRDPDGDVREQAMFWLAQAAGERAAGTIRDAIDDDPLVEVKQQAVFALSQLPPDEGVPLLIELARSHRLPEVREAAFFWLGQSDDPRALELFEEILR
jgi:HEAT repeat protein